MGGRATEGLGMADPRDRARKFSLRAGSHHLPMPPIPQKCRNPHPSRVQLRWVEDKVYQQLQK